MFFANEATSEKLPAPDHSLRTKKDFKCEEQHKFPPSSAVDLSC